MSSDAQDGEIASRLAVSTVLKYEEKLQSAQSAAQLAELVQTCVREADTSIRTSVGMYQHSGTTLALAILNAHGAYCFSLGDSRIYALRGKHLRRISHDHSWFAEHMGNREDFPPRRGKLYKLTGCIGAGSYRDAEAYPPVRGNYRLLLCSDGLTDKVSSSEIGKILSKCKHTDEAADMLLSLALRKGGSDNITVIVVDAKVTFPTLIVDEWIRRKCK